MKDGLRHLSCFLLAFGLVWEAGVSFAATARDIREWTAAANRGNAQAQFDLGVSYENGDGVAKNARKAEAWYLKAANQGHVDAQYNLGLLYCKDEGIPQNFGKAARWFTKAANQGDTDAMNTLAVFYVEGLGVQKNYGKAEMLFRNSCNGGNRLGCMQYEKFRRMVGR